MIKIVYVTKKRRKIVRAIKNLVKELIKTAEKIKAAKHAADM